MRTYIRLPLLLILTSCATLGTKINLGWPINPDSINRIGFVTSKSKFQDTIVNSFTDSVFIETLKDQLGKSTGKEIIYLGETKPYFKNTDSIISKNKIDAVIRCEIYLTQMLTLDNSKRFNCIVRTHLFKIIDKALIVETYFNTNTGKTYLRHPLLETAIRDGTIGAIRPLEKLFTTK